MIEYLGILDEGKLIEHHTTNLMMPKEINAMMTRLSKEQSTASSVIKQLRCGNHNIFYFSQGGYMFFLATREEKKRQRLHKYLSTVAEMFNEQYDERNFKHVLKYAVEEINRVERNTEEVMMVTDESDKLVERRTERLKMERPKPPPKLFSRANKLTIALFTAVVVLVCLYLRGS